MRNHLRYLLSNPGNMRKNSQCFAIMNVTVQGESTGKLDESSACSVMNPRTVAELL